MLAECNIEEQRSVVLFFCGQKDSMQRIFIKGHFLFMVGSVCHIKRLASESRNSLRDVRKPQMMPYQARKWLGQESKDFYAAGFDAPVKRWDKCINVGGGYVEKYMFFSRFEYRTFYVLLPFATYLLTLPRISCQKNLSSIRMTGISPF
jgi:hypothetical protein